MDKIIAFIGTGFMGSTVITGACRAVNSENIVITDFLPEKAEELSGKLGCLCTDSNIDAAKKADYIVLCVKPHIIPSVIDEISSILKQSYDEARSKTIISIAAGVQIDTIRGFIGISDYPVVRTLPNSPALIGKGLTLIACDSFTQEEIINDIKKIMSQCGAVQMLDEKLFDQATVNASCSPAYVYMFIEAMADAGVAIGLSRSDAQNLAASAVAGAAAMVLETGQHPGQLKDTVCSPGGSTIAGVAELERHGFRSAVIDAVKASFQKNIELGHQS